LSRRPFRNITTYRNIKQATLDRGCDNRERGILKTFGRLLPKGLRSQFSGRVRAAIDGDPILGAIIEPTLRVLEAMRAQLSGRNRSPT
jgi:hypothetical protein